MDGMETKHKLGWGKSIVVFLATWLVLAFILGMTWNLVSSGLQSVGLGWLALWAFPLLTLVGLALFVLSLGLTWTFHAAAGCLNTTVHGFGFQLVSKSQAVDEAWVRVSRATSHASESGGGAGTKHVTLLGSDGGQQTVLVDSFLHGWLGMGDRVHDLARAINGH